MRGADCTDDDLVAVVGWLRALDKAACRLEAAADLAAGAAACRI
jgi:hypothetical protein